MNSVGKEIKQLEMKVPRQICVTPFVKHERRRKEDIFVVFITSSATLRQGETFWEIYVYFFSSTFGLFFSSCH